MIRSGPSILLMNAAELLDKIRTRYLDDPVCAGDDANSLFSDDEIYDAINEAQKSFAVDTKMLRDAQTASVTQLSLTADDEWAELSSKIIEIKRARLTSPVKRFLEILDYQDMDFGSINFNDYFNINSSASWEDSEGTPRALILNMHEGAARIYPIPDASGTVQLTVVRLPLAEVNEATKLDDLEFDDVWKNALIFGALSAMYMREDSDETTGVDTARAREFDSLYQREVDKARRFRIEKQKKTGGTTRYGGIV